MTATGADTIWAYVYEDDGSYNQSPGSPTDTNFKTFGANVTADAIDRSNNAERMFRPFSREAETVLEGAFDGSLGADWTLANTWWLQFIFGKPATDGSGDPFTHTYNIGNDNPPRTAHVVEETHYKDGSVEQVVYTGVFANSIDLDVSVEDTVLKAQDAAESDDPKEVKESLETMISALAEMSTSDVYNSHFWRRYYDEYGAVGLILAVETLLEPASDKLEERQDAVDGFRPQG